MIRKVYKKKLVDYSIMVAVHMEMNQQITVDLVILAGIDLHEVITITQSQMLSVSKPEFKKILPSEQYARKSFQQYIKY